MVVGVSVAQLCRFFLPASSLDRRCAAICWEMRFQPARFEFVQVHPGCRPIFRLSVGNPRLVRLVLDGGQRHPLVLVLCLEPSLAGDNVSIYAQRVGASTEVHRCQVQEHSTEHGAQNTDYRLQTTDYRLCNLADGSRLLE